ncbi:MAG: homocysteine S-methyltransferase family protein [Clostridia bacterium]|nr:homocysteine S-methyltransferase family protein [Clostridia bacterium]
MQFLDFMRDSLVILDGGMGSMLAERELLSGNRPERLNLTHPDEICAIHRAYLEAGSRAVYANTFGANALHYGEDELARVIEAGIANARRAMEGLDGRFVALDIGPTGKLLRPLGDLDFEDAVEIFAKTVRLGARAGADFAVIETMSDSYETKAALLAVKENSELPVLVTLAFGEDGKLLSGASPEAMVALLEGMGADAIGVNCSKGPRQLRETVRRMLRVASVPVVFKPNAGLPILRDGRTEYDITPAELAREVAEAVDEGVRMVGGCCGTTPEHVRALVAALEGKRPISIEPKNLTCVSSYTHAVEFGASPLLVGERINPTGKPKLKEALRAGDMNYLLDEAVRQEASGAALLDVNVGLPDIDECQMLVRAVCDIQAVSDLPLELDSASPEALAAAMRRYNGKPMVNSVSGKRESMETVFPLVKKYGGVVVALTLDENGIPEDAEGRVAIARDILSVAESYGIDKKDIVFDTLTMAAVTSPCAAAVTLEALSRIRAELGCHTILGVSNISFGLPARPLIGSAFFTMALERGLSAAIMNPYSPEMMGAYHSYRALMGLDKGFADYIAFASSQAGEQKPKVAELTLASAIEKGLSTRAYELARTALATADPLAIIQSQIVPALERVGAQFEKGKLYLPQLLLAAEAAGNASQAVKEALPPKSAGEGEMAVVLATVKGDVHDIGKNIVKLLMENYGFAVTDLGKDVPAERIVAAARETGAVLVCLSALMTTTVPAMREATACLHAEVPSCKVMVGGAVLTRAVADEIGADVYAKDAMEAVRYAEGLRNKEIK